MFSQDDYQWMSRALELARRGRYTTAPNPCVGAVLVKDGVVVALNDEQGGGLAVSDAATLLKQAQG